MNDLLQIGQLVYSKAGRDKGKPFLIVDIPESNIVYIVDGSTRKVEKPKKKKVKHLLLTEKKDELFLEKIKSKRKISNLDIEKLIQELLKK